MPGTAYTFIEDGQITAMDVPPGGGDGCDREGLEKVLMKLVGMSRAEAREAIEGGFSFTVEDVVDRNPAE